MTEERTDDMTDNDIATLVGEYASTKAQADALYRRVKELEFELISALREAYPEEWGRWERGISSFKAEGVTVELKREYNIDALRAEFGEERNDLIVSEIVPEHIVEKADGRKLASMWRDAALAKRLEHCVIPPTPKVVIK